MFCYFFLFSLFISSLFLLTVFFIFLLGSGFRNSKYWTNEIGEFVRLRFFFVAFFLKKRNVILNVSLFLFFSSFEVLRMKSVSSSDFEASFFLEEPFYYRFYFFRFWAFEVLDDRNC